MAIARIETDGIEDGAVDSSKILDGILGAADIPNDTLTNTKFSNSAAIPTSKLTGLATSATTDTTSATNITSGSLATARVNVGTTAGKILQVDGSGNMPALDGSQLTGVESFTKSASDPTISTNPSGGVGTEWVNTTSGEIYLCTDATAGANVWTNVGAGSGNIDPWAFQGSSFGYAAGGGMPTSNVIQKYSFTSDANGTDVGDMLYSAQGVHCSRSIDYGYVAGGEPSLVHINKWSFASGAQNATDVGDLTVGRGFGDGTASGTHCYWHGGSPPYYSNVIDKNSVSTDGNAVDVGDMATATDSTCGMSSTTHGYCAGGNGSPKLDRIERYSFASDGNSVDTTQNLLTGISSPGGWASSTTYGYTAGGYTGSTIKQIQKYQFDTSNHATDVGDLTAGPNSGNCRNGGGSSSTTYGYRHGGWPSYRNEIEKWAFASDGDGVDVADLIDGMEEFSGTQA